MIVVEVLRFHFYRDHCAQVDASSASTDAVGGLAYGKRTGAHLQKALSTFATPERQGKLMKALKAAR